MISLPLVGDNVRENGFLLRLCNEKGGMKWLEAIQLRLMSKYVSRSQFIFIFMLVSIVGRAPQHLIISCFWL